ncbi:MAG: carbohydrate ABC transporter permease [Leptospiraceae bacterium]|nr:carbohydrate ABC transporter permease [Leptospiraceae bacterium]
MFALLPLFWMFITAFKKEGLGLQTEIIPKGSLSELYTLSNFTAILADKDFPFFRFLLNSTIVAGSAAIVSSAICFMSAYAFARKNFPGKEFIYGLLMASMMVPGMIFMVPQFALITQFGWMNSWQGLVIPHTANVFGIFLLRQAIERIPKSLFEAAEVDGASDWQIMFLVIVPLSSPVLLTLFLLTFLGQWSNFLWQLIVNTPDSPWITLPVGISLFKGQYSIAWEKMMAASVISVLPVLLLFIFLQRYIISGLTQGGVKE